MVWLQLACSNNNPKVHAKNFLQFVAECGGCPVKVRSDCGTGNGVLVQSSASSEVQPMLMRLGLLPRGVGGGVLPEKLGGVCGPLPKTLTLFMTKICDFCYPIYDLTKNSIPYL